VPERTRRIHENRSDEGLEQAERWSHESAGPVASTETVGTQEKTKEVAAEERGWLGLGLMDPLDPYALAREHGIPVYPIDELPDEHCSQKAVTHSTLNRSKVWSAALVPIGTGRIILENTGHASVRRRSSLAHELSHHFLEHKFDDVLLTDDGCRRFDKKQEKDANFLAGELLVPYQAALKAAFAEKTNEEVATIFGVSSQFAQMCMKGARVHAQRALAKQATIGRR
jgi:Zn-dependent peptidase ImmA (M78 family)